MKATVMLATFPFGSTECLEVRNWLIKTHKRIEADDRVAHLYTMDVDDTPITMSRNRVLKTCLDQGIDFCLMVDSDMNPDAYLGRGFADVKPFWDSSFEFMLEHEGPCVVAAPYCGPPPIENVYVFRWANFQSGHPNPDYRLEPYGREEATLRMGMERVGALPTGVCLIDMRGVKRLEPPWFDYEYTDKYRTQKASTEDVFFTRNLDLAGVPQYVNWDAWAEHVKRKRVGRPTMITSDVIKEQFRDALLRGHQSGERIIDVMGPVRDPILIAGEGAPEFKEKQPCSRGRGRKRKAS